MVFNVSVLYRPLTELFTNENLQPIFTFLALGYLVAAPLWVQSIHNEWAVLVVEAVTWVLWYDSRVINAIAVLC
jgi:hypothetical protein